MATADDDDLFRFLSHRREVSGGIGPALPGAYATRGPRYSAAAKTGSGLATRRTSREASRQAMPADRNASR